MKERMPSSFIRDSLQAFFGKDAVLSGLPQEIADITTKVIPYLSHVYTSHPALLIDASSFDEGAVGAKSRERIFVLSLTIL